MKKIYYHMLMGLFCLLTSQVAHAQPADLVLSASGSGTQLHQSSNSITSAAGYSCIPNGGTLSDEIAARSISGDIVYSPAINPDSYSINTSLALKSNPINISVSGTPVCKIPIEVPKGINGLQPNLSLNYTGNFIPGIFGTGWNIEGLSMIGRVNQNIYHDDQSNPIKGTLSDRYSLDGNRLIVVSGTYGTAGSEYRTEREEFSKITAYGSAGQGPQYFIVYTKSGLICEYGNSSDSRALLDGINVLFWKINKISDRYGNYITFKYIPTDNEHPIGEIEYTGNTSQSTAPFAKINFNYKNRSNISTYMLGEVKFSRSILLTEISITNNGQLFKRYELDYCKNNNYPLLQKITEYSSKNQSFNPQIFTYTNQTEQFSAATPYSATVKERIYQGDFNGDGRMDIVTVPLLTDQSLNKKWKVYVADQNGNFSFFWEGPIVADINVFIVADFNGDGLSDFAQIDFFNSSVSDVYYFPSTGTGFGNPYLDSWRFADPYPNIYVVDYNGDGQLEVLGYEDEENARYELRTYSGEFIHEGRITGTGSLPPFNVGSNYFQVQDFNGDGCSDLLTLNDTGFRLHEFKGADNKLMVTSTGDKLKNTYSLRYGDFNGDGTTEVLRTLGPETPGWCLVYYTKYGFKEQPITGLPDFKLYANQNRWNCCDLNGDGKMDIILWGKGSTSTSNKIYTAINQVNGYEYNLQEYTSPVNIDMSDMTPDNPLYFYFGDYNGDTREEFFYSEPGSQRRFAFASGTTSNLMKVTIDGLGTKTSLTYLPSSNWSVYEGGVRPDYPLANYTKAIHLVSAVSRDNGIGGNTTINYKYEGAKIHLQGKGFLGFSKTTETNNATGIITIKDVAIRGTYYYPYLSSVVTLNTSGALFSAGNSWDELEFGNKRFFPYVYTSIESNELTKLYATTIQDYFSDGNLKSVTKVFSNGPIHTTEFLYHDERTADWLIGRSTTITERSVKGTDTRTFVTNRSYFTTNNSPDVDQYNTGDASAWQLDREYDAFGNLWKEHRSTTGLSTRTTVYTYDSNGVNLSGITDPVGRVNSYTYVPATGLIGTQTDPFGNLTTYIYSNADQLDLASRELGISTVYSRSLNVTGGPANARYYIRETGSDHSQVTTWYDKLEREIRKETRSFSGTMIKVDQQYNAKGQLYRISEPATGTPSNWNVIGYDNCGRVISQDPYYGATTTYSYSDSIITRTVNGRTYTSIINSTGLVSKRTDPGGSMTYAYYPDGLLKSTLAPGNVTTAMTYDRNGNRLSIADPSAGTITNTWYGTGEIKTNQSARGQTTTYTYQTDGLLDKYTTTAEGETNYTYNTKGQVTNITSPGGISRSHTYDTRGRVNSVTESIDGISNSVTFGYDVPGRLYQKYFNGSTDYEQYDYNINGYLYRISFNGTPVWELTEMDEYGRYRYALIGNSPATPYLWEYGTNNTLSQIEGLGLGIYEYSFNVNTGNLNSRTNVLNSLSESFGYDAVGLDRLTSVTGPSSMSTGYGSNGNILTKSDAGTGSYAYNNTPYAVSSITGALNISPTPQQIDYYSFEKVKKITEGTKTADFVYNADQQRIRMILKDNGATTKIRWYFGGSQEREQADSDVTEYIWIGGDAYTAVAVARKTGSGSWEVFYIFRDHLGTITHLRNSATDLVDEYSFDT
ncbi:MAG: FG-GAP-like repeat-containing protein [Mangrovibacterium sp.]